MTERNSRFRELAPGVPVEMIATQIRLAYEPNGLERPESLTATWWGQEFTKVGDSHELIGNRGDRLETRLSDYADTLITITDPITGQEVTLSAAGWVVWGMKFYDHAHNAVNAPPPDPEPEPEPEPEPDPEPDPED